jgi:hypothetical protein
MMPTDPLDRTHAASAEAIANIRNAVARARLAVLLWEPAPYPKEEDDRYTPRHRRPHPGFIAITGPRYIELGTVWTATRPDSGLPERVVRHRGRLLRRRPHRH